jgi:Tfp pilus assembly protein PilO
MNTQKSISSQTLLLILSGVITILLITLTVLQVIKINDLNKALPEMRATVQNNKERLENLKYLDSIRPYMEQAVDILSRQLPEEPMEHQIIDHINGIARKYNTDFIDIYFSDRAQTNNLLVMPLKISFSGSYKSFVKVLNELEHGERLLRIDTMKINKPDSGLSEIKAEITAAAFSGQ